MKSKKGIMKKLVCAVLTVAMAFSLCACGAGSSKNAEDGDAIELNIAYQYGLAYAPLVVAKENKLIEKAYEEATGKTVTVNWIQMNSGADINTGIASGELNVGFMGVGPAITGVTKNVGYKIFTNLSGQEHGIMVNDDSINSLNDFVESDKQIGVVNIGSIQHIMLAMALDNEGIDPHALDSNLIALKHPDGKTSLESGNIAAHVTSSPYIYMERNNDSLHEIESVKNAWTKDDSFIVGVASISLHDSNPELYKALCDGIGEAITYVEDNSEETAKLTYELDGNTIEDEVAYLKGGYYSVETKSVFRMASFMFENNFIDSDPVSYENLVFDNVVGD